MTSKPSIVEISRLSGVSVATVSRIIHQNGRFSKATEERVRRVMEQLNYSPNVLAQSMRSQVMPIISLIVPDILYEPASQFVRAAQQRLYQYGYTASVFNSKSNREMTLKYIEMMKSQCTAGFLVIPDVDLEDDCFGNTPVLFAWNKPNNIHKTPYMTAKFDYRKAGFIAAEHLISRGCRELCILGYSNQHSMQQEFYTGYSEALDYYGLSNYPKRQFPVDFLRTTEGIILLNHYLDQYGLDFDGIVCSSQRHSIAALSVFQNRKIIMPDQVKMIGYGEMRMASYGLLQYSAIAENAERFGWQAADMLVHRIRQEETIPVFVDDVELHIGITS